MMLSIIKQININSSLRLNNLDDELIGNKECQNGNRSNFIM
jgi:hypothetical protein